MKQPDFLKNLKVGSTLFMMGTENTPIEYYLTVTKIGRKYFYCTSPKNSFEHKFYRDSGISVQDYGDPPCLHGSKKDYNHKIAKMDLYSKISIFFRTFNNYRKLTLDQLKQIIEIIGED